MHANERYLRLRFNVGLPDADCVNYDINEKLDRIKRAYRGIRKLEYNINYFHLDEDFFVGSFPMLHTVVLTGFPSISRTQSLIEYLTSNAHIFPATVKNIEIYIRITVRSVQELEAFTEMYASKATVLRFFIDSRLDKKEIFGSLAKFTKLTNLKLDYEINFNDILLITKNMNKLEYLSLHVKEDSDINKITKNLTLFKSLKHIKVESSFDVTIVILLEECKHNKDIYKALRSFKVNNYIREYCDLDDSRIYYFPKEKTISFSKYHITPENLSYDMYNHIDTFICWDKDFFKPLEFESTFTLFFNLFKNITNVCFYITVYLRDDFLYDYFKAIAKLYPNKMYTLKQIVYQEFNAEKHEMLKNLYIYE